MQNNLKPKKIQFLTNLKIVSERNAHYNLVLLEVDGYSKDEHVGVPCLVKKSVPQNAIDGILEFDLMLEPLEKKMRKFLNWSTRTVFDLNEFPEKLRGIKVNALNNSDIALIEPLF
jgi:hypothetical protein